MTAELLTNTSSHTWTNTVPTNSESLRMRTMKVIPNQEFQDLSQTSFSLDASVRNHIMKKYFLYFMELINELWQLAIGISCDCFLLVPTQIPLTEQPTETTSQAAGNALC